MSILSQPQAVAAVIAEAATYVAAQSA
jgi:hypothetical protein